MAVDGRPCDAAMAKAAHLLAEMERRRVERLFDEVEAVAS